MYAWNGWKSQRVLHCAAALDAQLCVQMKSYADRCQKNPEENGHAQDFGMNEIANQIFGRLYVPEKLKRSSQLGCAFVDLTTSWEPKKVMFQIAVNLQAQLPWSVMFQKRHAPAQNRHAHTRYNITNTET